MPKQGKGSTFEREICRTLSLWWSDNERDDLFWRAATSGAMATSRSKKGKSTFGQHGDVQATDPIGQPLLDVFTIELKRGYNSFSLIDMLDKKETASQQQFELFFRQVEKDSGLAESMTWMVIWRKDRRNPLVFIPRWVIYKLKGKDTHFSFPHLMGRIQCKNGDCKTVFCCPLDVFLKEISPNDVKKMVH